MTWALLQRGVDLQDAEAIAEAAEDVRLRRAPIRSLPRSTSTASTWPARSAATRSPATVSVVAAVPRVREMLVRAAARDDRGGSDGIVVEGRDIGSTVAPRRTGQDLSGGRPGRPGRPPGRRDSAQSTRPPPRAALARRDEIDSTRAASPLAKADGRRRGRRHPPDARTRSSTPSSRSWTTSRAGAHERAAPLVTGRSAGCRRRAAVVCAAMRGRGCDAALGHPRARQRARARATGR